MHTVTGAFSLNKNLSSNIFNPDSVFSSTDVIAIQVEKDVSSRFIQSVETPVVFAACTGYFDQPINEDRCISLESIVNYYCESGSLPEADLFGSFQFFLFDKEKQQLYLFTDRGALRTIFYVVKDNTLFFSNKIHALKNINDEFGTPNASQRDFALTFGYYPGNSTVYEDIKKLSGEVCFKVSDEIEELQFKSQKALASPNLNSEDEVIEQLYSDLFKAIEKQTDGYDRVAVHLGGFDSALVASYLKRIGKTVQTYTFRFDDEEFNQTHTDTLSKFLGIKHSWVDITPQVFKDSLPSYAVLFDQPTNWANYVVQTAYATEFVKKDGFEICLSGDGCDTLFQGYPGVNRSAKFYNKISPIIKPAARPLLWLLNHAWLENKLGHVYRLIMRVIRNARKQDPLRTFLMFRIFDESSIARTFKDTTYKQVSDKVDQQALVIGSTIPDNISLNKLAYLGRSNMGPNRTKLSGTMDHTGVIIHSPFMHNEIKKMVGCYPDHLLRPKDSGNTMKDIGKYILTKMAQKYNLLPDEIIFQKKQAPVNSPIDDWYREELSTTVVDMLQKSPWEIDVDFVKTGLTDKKWAEEKYKQKISSDKVTSHALSLLLTTLAFYER